MLGNGQESRDDDDKEEVGMEGESAGDRRGLRKRGKKGVGGSSSSNGKTEWELTCSASTLLI